MRRRCCPGQEGEEQHLLEEESEIEDEDEEFWSSVVWEFTDQKKKGYRPVNNGEVKKKYSSSQWFECVVRIWSRYVFFLVQVSIYFTIGMLMIFASSKTFMAGIILCAVLFGFNLIHITGVCTCYCNRRIRGRYSAAEWVETRRNVIVYACISNACQVPILFIVLLFGYLVKQTFIFNYVVMFTAFVITWFPLKEIIDNLRYRGCRRIVEEEPTVEPIRDIEIV